MTLEARWTVWDHGGGLGYNAQLVWGGDSAFHLPQRAEVDDLLDGLASGGALAFAPAVSRERQSACEFFNTFVPR